MNFFIDLRALRVGGLPAGPLEHRRTRACILKILAAAMGLVCLSALSTATSAQCAPGNLAVIVNKSSHVDSLSVAQLRRLILGDVRNWPDDKPVTIVAREPSSNVTRCVLSKVVRLSDAEYRRYVMSAEFRGEEALVSQTATSDAYAAKIVVGAATSFAVVDAASVAAFGDTVKVVRIGGKLPGQPDYPL